MKIKQLTAREIIDSRGQPTLEVGCELATGATARAGVPSGASTGLHEAWELRDGDEARYRGKGVSKAVLGVTGEINQALAGQEFDQASLDGALVKLDGTPNKARLGANAILGVSLAWGRAAARERSIPLYKYLGELAGVTDFKLPEPAFNVLNGGKHADSGLDWQEFMLLPLGLKTIKRKLQAASEIIASLREKLLAKGYAVGLGDEGGFAPRLGSNEEGLALLVEAIQAAGYSTADVKIGLDVAASSFYKAGAYQLKIAGVEKRLNSDELVNYYVELAGRHPLISIEDGLAEDDWEGFAKLNAALGGKLKIIGDDLTVTNIDRIGQAAAKQAINGVIIKPNQIGTLTETLAAVKLTQAQNWTAFASHRSGETNDDFIADLAVGFGCAYLKSGSLARGERVAKYNRLMEIEAELGLC